MFLDTKPIVDTADHAFERVPTAVDEVSSHNIALAPVYLLQVIDENLSDAELSPAGIAKMLGMSRASLYRMAAPYGGVQRIITDRRLQAAHTLLSCEENTKYSISTLTYDLGFNAESTFRRVYKQRYGVSPRATKQASLAG